MPFKFWKSPSFEEQFKTLQAETLSYYSKIGGWPNNISSQAEAQQIGNRWMRTVQQVEKLLREYPQSVEVKLLLGDLFRMGHNMDVPNAAAASDVLLKEVLALDPESYFACYLLASLYVSANPELAPLAESYFLKAEQIARRAGKEPAEDIYQGLGFACLHQHKKAEAISYFEKYLQLKGANPEIAKLLDGLKAGKESEIIFRELGS